MKFGEIIDYMMESRQEETVESGNITCKGEYFYPEEGFCYYRIQMFREMKLGTFKILEVNETEWEEFNNANIITYPDKSYCYLSYEYEDRYGNRKKSVKEYNNIKNIKRRCEYEGSNIIMINLH